MRSIPVTKKPSFGTSSNDLTACRENVRTLLESLVKNMVDKMDQDSVTADIEIGDQTTVYKLSFNKNCVGKVLGVGGKNITALRTIILAICSRQGFRAVIEVPHIPK
ncbi:KH domain-containing protein [uncultured Bdellovibrio sp.]|uniref:KH domain-containing protein n=1 Tax=Bdellovibrio sp. HCB-162 TaxID=3394234 RepID=UPI0025D1FC73|nr:KH domain-containing protein [uncultured Bdellovibrio sp.]